MVEITSIVVVKMEITSIVVVKSNVSIKVYHLFDLLCLFHSTACLSVIPDECHIHMSFFLSEQSVHS
jgi:hypothetical protein